VWRPERGLGRGAADHHGSHGAEVPKKNAGSGNAAGGGGMGGMGGMDFYSNRSELNNK